MTEPGTQIDGVEVQDGDAFDLHCPSLVVPGQTLPIEAVGAYVLVALQVEHTGDTVVALQLIHVTWRARVGAHKEMIKNGIVVDHAYRALRGNERYKIAYRRKARRSDTAFREGLLLT